jgi:Poxvirus Late Transcription Factor VLTF3 like
MATLETTNNLILLKIKSLKDIAAIVSNCAASEKINSLIDDVQEISDDYEMGSIKILTNYFLLAQNHQIYNQADYQTFIKKNNFIGKIDRYYTNLKNMVSSLLKNNNEKINTCINDIKYIFASYENCTIVQSVSNTLYNKCNKCSREMKIFENLSEITCTHCGVTDNLYGTVFEDFQFYFQEGARTKHGSYDPSKHCRFWIERIQARESKEIPESVINSIRICIRSNKVRNIEDLTCKEIRKYLSQTRNSIYNEHIPLIRKIITGKSPAQLTDQELQLITIYFDKVIRIYDDIKPITKTNVPYHPYLIYKIIEHILKCKSTHDYHMSKRRIYSILGCIHLQSRETLIENDKTWQEICSYIDEIEYSPTDRNCQYDDL